MSFRLGSGGENFYAIWVVEGTCYKFGRGERSYELVRGKMDGGERKSYLMVKDY